MTEKQSQLACLVVGGVLVLEALAMLGIAAVAGTIGTLVGALAIGVGGGSATNEQFAKGILIMVLTLASPFLAAAILGLEGCLLVARKKGGLIITAGLLAIAAQFAFHPLFEQAFHVAELALCAVQLLAIALAFALVRAKSALHASSS
jgi:hypothetical protein